MKPYAEYASTSCRTPASRVPLEIEGREYRFQLGEIDAVVAHVPTCTIGERQARARYGISDQLGDVADLHVVDRAPDVERLVVHILPRRLSHGQNDAANVLDVHQRSPRRAVALEAHLARRCRDGCEVVHDDVDPQARRAPVGRGVAQEGRAEPVVGKRREITLGENFRLAVCRHWRQLGLLGHAPIGARGARGSIETARRGENEALDRGLLGGSGQVHRALVIYRVGSGAVEGTERIVGKSRKTYDRVVAGEIANLNVPDVQREPLAHILGRRFEVAPFVETDVQSVDQMAAGT